MKHYFSCALIAMSVFCSGCVSHVKQTTGTIATADISASSSAIAKDSVSFLSQQFSPANTRLNITQSVLQNDVFSQEFVDQLRQRGFEIQENSAVSSYNNMNFTLDSNDSMGFIRILINIDNSTYSRCYSNNGSPLSSWSVIKK